MKSGELNSAECYESSETSDRNNQPTADALDLVIRELSQASTALLAARILIQSEPYPVQIWHDLEHLREMAAGVKVTCDQVRKEAARECTHTGPISPSEYVKA